MSSRKDSNEATQRRMAALFLLAIGLIVWQAPLTKPTLVPPSVLVTGPGEQLFPLAVPDGEPPLLPAEPAARRAFLAEHAVAWDLGPDPAGSCALFLRVSPHHWTRRALSPAALIRLAGRPSGATTDRDLRLAARDFADDDDGDSDPLDAGELHYGPPGAEVEVECPAGRIAASGPP